jgi:glucuronate isomerase
MLSNGDKMNWLEDRIKEQAYHIWKEEGCPEGRAEAHWEQARRVLSPNDSHGPGIQNEIQIETVHATDVPLAAVGELQKQASRSRRTAPSAGARKPRSKRPTG